MGAAIGMALELAFVAIMESDEIRQAFQRDEINRVDIEFDRATGASARKEKPSNMNPAQLDREVEKID